MQVTFYEDLADLTKPGLGLLHTDNLMEKIAHSLVHLYRYNGSVYTGVNVARHSERVSRFYDKRKESTGYYYDYNAARTRMALLLHDAPEAFYGDLITPLKDWCDMRPELKKFDKNIFDLIYKHYKMPLPTKEMLKLVKEADQAEYKYERKRINAQKTLFFPAGRNMESDYHDFMARFRVLLGSIHRGETVWDSKTKKRVKKR